MLYPFTFKPILKKVIWGGSAICPFKGITPVENGVGESWELSHVEGNYSVVANGELEGKSLDDLIQSYGKQLLGEKVVERFGTTFPLLIKFIDARDHLSIQVHPDDELAKKRHNSFGKTEMWYVIKAEKGAGLYSGFSQQIDAEEYVKRVENNTIMDVLQRYDVHEGDVFFLPAGRVHAIGAGCFIAEIQQTSNITYRIYDYNRKDAQGNGCIRSWLRMRLTIRFIPTTARTTRHVPTRQSLWRIANISRPTYWILIPSWYATSPT